MTDLFDAGLALGAGGTLAEFNRAGNLDAADVHVASCLGRLAGETDPEVLLAVALAVRAPRTGSVLVDLSRIADQLAGAADQADPVGDTPEPDWPEPEGWRTRVAASPLVASGVLHLEGTNLSLDRYWRDEQLLGASLEARSTPFPGVDGAVLEDGLDRLFRPAPGAGPDLQRRAAATAVLRRFTVVSGGPGTGKTTTVARILALLHEQAPATGGRPPLVALAAPTGKAAARLQEAVRQSAAGLDCPPAVREAVAGAAASTLHRLLGSQPWASTRFRHHHDNLLPHDVVVVDECSMASLSLMARLVDAVRPDARLILVGDHEQLASVEAGAVLGDIVGPAGTGTATGAMAEAVVVLRRRYRYEGAIAELASAIQADDGDATLAVLRGGAGDVVWLEPDQDTGPLREAAVAAGTALRAAAVGGEDRAALDELGRFRLLCAHREGPFGAAAWRALVEGWLGEAGAGPGPGGRWYPGQPLMVTGNDYDLGLWNGDTGVVMTRPEGRLEAVFDRSAGVLACSPGRLGRVETIYAMTVHKAQGSQFDTVAVVLPEPTSRILTRELLYTAVTRARGRVILVGSEESVRAGVGRPIARASGLRGRLWGEA